MIEPSKAHCHSLALNLTAELLATFNKTLKDFGLPQPAFSIEEMQGNRLILEQLEEDFTRLNDKVQQEVRTIK
jgi:hypothetical protein